MIARVSSALPGPASFLSYKVVYSSGGSSSSGSVHVCVCIYIYMFYSSELYLSFGGGRSGSVVDPMEKGSAAANQTAIGCLEVGEGRTPLLYARGAAQLLLLLHSISSSLRTTGAKGNKGVAHRTRASGRSHRGLIEEGGERDEEIYIYTLARLLFKLNHVAASLCSEFVDFC